MNVFMLTFRLSLTFCRLRFSHFQALCRIRSILFFWAPYRWGDLVPSMMCRSKGLCFLGALKHGSYSTDVLSFSTLFTDASLLNAWSHFNAQTSTQLALCCFKTRCFFGCSVALRKPCTNNISYLIAFRWIIADVLWLKVLLLEYFGAALSSFRLLVDDSLVCFRLGATHCRSAMSTWCAIVRPRSGKVCPKDRKVRLKGTRNL